MLSTGKIMLVTDQRGLDHMMLERSDGRHLNLFQDDRLQPESTYDGKMVSFSRALPYERAPRPGDDVLFIGYSDASGARARPWCYQDEWERVTAELEHTPENQALYRVLRVVENCVTECTPQVHLRPMHLWALNRQVPRHPNPRGDFLSVMGGADFTIRFVFERQTPEGWVRCEDPRPVCRNLLHDPRPRMHGRLQAVEPTAAMGL